MDRPLVNSIKAIQEVAKDDTTLPLPGTIARAVTKTPSKMRSLSDSVPQLSPSPKFKEPRRKASDDNVLIATPSRILSKDLSGHSLSLQMPPKETSAIHPTNYPSPAPYTSQVEGRDPYGSPTTVLPRHSRGLDFSRAATNLHHSTIAEQPSPDSSPTITQKSLMQSSRRASSHSMVLDSPRLGSGWNWMGGQTGERLFFPRSVGSTTAMMSDTSSSGSDDDMSIQQGDSEESTLTTPQVSKFENSSAPTPFGLPRRSTSGGNWMESRPPMPPAFATFRHNRQRKEGGRHSSDSADSRSRMTTPDPQSSRPESTMTGYFGRDTSGQNSASRRESLSLGTNGLHITSSNEDEDANPFGPQMTPGVVRRAVTRRSNLLPKTKGFARIRAALQEENAPVDSEAKREAEVVKQVQAHQYGQDPWAPSGPTTAPSSPDLNPTIPGMPRDESTMSDIEAVAASSGLNYGSSITDQRRGSNHKEFRSSIYNNHSRMQTPPPFANRARSSSGVSDVGMESPQVSTPPTSIFSSISTQPAAATMETDMVPSQPQPSNMPSTADIVRKVNKRRRDEDFDLASIKRRAVSPGLSVQSSPILGQSPVSTANGWTGPQRPIREIPTGMSIPEERMGSVSQAPPSAGLKRVGLQGMTDTSDGLMKMSIE